MKAEGDLLSSINLPELRPIDDLRMHLFQLFTLSESSTQVNSTYKHTLQEMIADVRKPQQPFLLETKPLSSWIVK